MGTCSRLHFGSSTQFHEAQMQTDANSPHSNTFHLVSVFSQTPFTLLYIADTADMLSIVFNKRCLSCFWSCSSLTELCWIFLLCAPFTQGLCAVLGRARGGGGGLDCEHGRGERLLPEPAEDWLHHRQPAGRLWFSILIYHTQKTLIMISNVSNMYEKIFYNFFVNKLEVRRSFVGWKTTELYQKYFISQFLFLSQNIKY